MLMTFYNCHVTFENAESAYHVVLLADMSTRRLQQFDTGLTADTVEWCPVAPNENIVACGAYQLDTEAGRRHGSLSVHKFTYNSQGCPTYVGVFQ